VWKLVFPTAKIPSLQLVSEELSSVETDYIEYEEVAPIFVSEELSSVETSINPLHHLHQNQVSEELSSVETG